MISITDLHFAYPGSSFRLRVESLNVATGQSLALLGPSGVGKTTLLRLMTGLLQPSSGQVKLGDTSLGALDETARRAFRLKEVGLVFQDFALLDYLTVEENILLPQRFHGKGPNAASIQQARLLAERLEIEKHWQKLAGQLSQGERQRVAIARALAHRPRYLFTDEPTASLDATRRGVVMDLLRDYTQENEASLIMVTHDTELIPLFPFHARVEDFTK
ncbi:MAG: ATP-binding cassette domain-containing protein [Verrucomicrobia bacterium]|nr:ATP-binding cassette domain-containing protein [Verrucomicrobiota bacterium]